MTRLAGLFVAGAAAAALGCNADTSLERLTEARRLSADMLVQFTKASDAANRAVMADTDGAAASYAREADQMSQAVEQDMLALTPLLTQLRYRDESQRLDEFRLRFAAYRVLDRSVLELAVAGTNLKAQRLSFGEGREVADALVASLAALVPRDTARDGWQVQARVAAAGERTREIQALQAPHIAEPDDAAMTGIEQRMTTAETTARAALRALVPLVDEASQSRLAAATVSFDRFMTVNAEIVALSRQNTNVRSLALSLNQKRLATAACDESLRALADALASRGFSATR